MNGRNLTTRRRAGLLGSLVAMLTLACSGSALAATIVGTPKNDVIRGTAKADKLYGKAGNDKLIGLGGNDLLVGGSGNDVLIGGPGADKLQCGPGRDTVQADAKDTVGADCEIVKGPILPSLGVGDASVVEGNSGTTTLSFPVTLSKPVTWSVSVSFATANGSATAGSDYTASNGTLTFAPGETSKTIDVAVIGDTTTEPDETLSVALSSPVNTTIGDGSATGTIRNDDQPHPRSGHYAGMTSQNREMGFDVSADGTSLSNLKFGVDVECSEVDFRVTDLPIDFGSSPIPLKPNGSFSISDNESDSGVDVSFSVGGTVALSGSASGTLRVDFAVHTPDGSVHCSTDTVTWSAT